MECWEIARILGLEDEPQSAEAALMARWEAHQEGRQVTSWAEVNT